MTFSKLLTGQRLEINKLQRTEASAAAAEEKKLNVKDLQTLTCPFKADVQSVSAFNLLRLVEIREQHHITDDGMAGRSQVLKGHEEAGWGWGWWSQHLVPEPNKLEEP